MVSEMCYEKNPFMVGNLTSTAKYVWNSDWNANSGPSVLRIARVVSRSSFPKVTEYVMPNLWFFHSEGMLSSSILFESPKSSFTDESPEFFPAADSEEDLPRYSHVDMRAKPCWGRPEVGWF